jgi:hypothetical protein
MMLHGSVLLHHLLGALADTLSELPEDGAEAPKHVGALVI